MRYFLTVFFLSIALFGALPALAQITSDFYIYPEDNLHGQVNPNTGLAYAPPPEPMIPQVKFLKVEEPLNLQEQVDRLLQGIKVDIPPEFDQYGYEMRRYMAQVGNPEIYSSEKRRADELNNIKKAKIILEYWIKDLRKQTQDIAAAIEAQNASSNVRDTFKYNSGIVGAFQVECQSWLDNNEALLKFLTENPDAYIFTSPNLQFREVQGKFTFQALFEARDKARKEINEYSPFAGMVY